MNEQIASCELAELHEALAEIPEKYHSDVCRAITHDIGVMSRTLTMVEKQNA